MEKQTNPFSNINVPELPTKLIYSERKKGVAENPKLATIIERLDSFRDFMFKIASVICSIGAVMLSIGIIVVVLIAVVYYLSGALV